MAHGLAGAAIDAIVGVDVQLPVDTLLVLDAVHRTHLDAGPVQEVDARLRDYIGHRFSSTCGSGPPARCATIRSVKLGNSLSVAMLFVSGGASQEGNPLSTHRFQNCQRLFPGRIAWLRI